MQDRTQTYLDELTFDILPAVFSSAFAASFFLE